MIFQLSIPGYLVLYWGQSNRKAYWYVRIYDYYVVGITPAISLPGFQEMHSTAAGWHIIPISLYCLMQNLKVMIGFVFCCVQAYMYCTL